MVAVPPPRFRPSRSSQAAPRLTFTLAGVSAATDPVLSHAREVEPLLASQTSFVGNLIYSTERHHVNWVHPLVANGSFQKPGDEVASF